MKSLLLHVENLLAQCLYLLIIHPCMLVPLLILFSFLEPKNWLRSSASSEHFMKQNHMVLAPGFFDYANVFDVHPQCGICLYFIPFIAE